MWLVGSYLLRANKPNIPGSKETVQSLGLQRLRMDMARFVDTTASGDSLSTELRPSVKTAGNFPKRRQSVKNKFMNLSSDSAVTPESLSLVKLWQKAEVQEAQGICSGKVVLQSSRT